MANEIRLRRNNIAGTITDNPLTNVSTTINSPGFVDLPTVDATNHLILILDPLETNGPAEIVRVTTHTVAASVVTVTRGAEGSAARSHILGTTWFHGPVTSDTTEVLTSSTRPSVPYEGELIYETDTDDVFLYNGASWCRVYPARVSTRTNGAAVTTSGTAESTLASIVIAAQNFPYRIWISAQVFHTQTVAGDAFSLAIKDSAAITSTSRGQQAAESLLAQDYIDVPGGGSKTINVVLFRAAGSGTSSTFADSTSNFITTTIEAL